MKTEKNCGCIILKDNKVLSIGAKNDVEQIKWISIDQAEGFLTDHYSIAWKEFLNRSDKN